MIIDADLSSFGWRASPPWLPYAPPLPAAWPPQPRTPAACTPQQPVCRHACRHVRKHLYRHAHRLALGVGIIVRARMCIGMHAREARSFSAASSVRLCACFSSFAAASTASFAFACFAAALLMPSPCTLDVWGCRYPGTHPGTVTQGYIGAVIHVYINTGMQTAMQRCSDGVQRP